jgi:hypothetical protein
MSFLELFGISRKIAAPSADARTEQVQPSRPLRRVLEFTGHTIDDVINSPIARNEVAGYYKLHRWVERESEMSDLERQWNSTPRKVRR